jgi:glycosyltransferase involved in cell wall biosynthesis
MAKYSAQNVLLCTHGTFASVPSPPDFSKRGNPDLRILAIGHWGTYKRLETLMEAFPLVLKRIPNARLIVAGANHHTKAGYWESIREAQPANLPIEFRGYVPEEEIPELFRSTSIVVMPYDSATGSSGPAHQACEYGVPIVCADIPEFQEMVADEGMAARFYDVGDANGLAEQLVTILQSSELQHQMAECNYTAGVQMTMASVVSSYLRWFQLNQYKRSMLKPGLLRFHRRPSLSSLTDRATLPGWGLEPSLSADGTNGAALPDGLSVDFADSIDWRRQVAAKEKPDGDGYRVIPTFEG